MTCPSCGKRAELYPAEFILIPGWQAYKCQDCIDNKMEPRFTVVLAALLKLDSPYLEAILNYSYYGDPILSEETKAKRPRN